MIRLLSWIYRTYDVAEEEQEINDCTLNSWPDNASLDKARRLLWPIKKNTETKAGQI
jgi:catalase (peroxidase I)